MEGAKGLGTGGVMEVGSERDVVGRVEEVECGGEEKRRERRFTKIAPSTLSEKIRDGGVG